MCGRTACTLHPDEISKFCRYTNDSGHSVNLKWIDQQLYEPTFNLGPTKYAPVIMRGESEEERIIRSVRWGLYTRRYNSKSPPAMVINARAETLLEKQTFKIPLAKGKRCVVLADGYFEWRRAGNAKEPYFIHLPKGNGISHDGTGSTQTSKPLAIAGLYDTIKDTIGFAVITVTASKTISHIHDRMPAILDGEKEIQNWLEGSQLQQTVDALKPKEVVEFYRVSSFVNNIKNNSPKCLQPHIEQQKTALEKWLKRPASKEESTSTKRLKTQ